MTDRPMPPAINGTEERLDAVIALQREIRDLLTPETKPEPEDGETVELREPEPTPTPRKRPAKAARK